MLSAAPDRSDEHKRAKLLGLAKHLIHCGRATGAPACCSHLFQGGYVDPQLKKLIKELGDAISDTLTESSQIAEVISRIRAGGHDVFLVLEATVGFNEHEDRPSKKRSRVSTRTRVPDFKLNTQDMQFLKSLNISVEDPA
jgi:hypothetical protein